MATLTINNSNKPTAMRLRLTYTAGSGNITITKIESCRTDSYGDTNDQGNCTVYVKVGSDERSFSKTGIYFKDNNEYSTILEQNISYNVTGSQNVQITFSSSNSNISGSNFTTSINAGVRVPTIQLGAGYDSSHRFTIPNSSEGVSFYLGNTNNLTTYFQYYVGTWKNFTNRSSDGWYGHTITSAQATEILTYLNNTAYPNLQVRAWNENGASSTIYLYLVVDTSIKPTLDSISVSAYCNISGFENMFIKGLSKPVVTFNNAQGVEGSTITTYLMGTLTGDNRSDVVLSMNGNTTNLSNFNNLSVAGTNRISGYVKDTRSRASSGVAQTFEVIDYNTPSLVSLSINRCLQNGTLSEDGEYAKLNISYKVYPVNDGSTDKNTKALYYSLDNSTWTQLTTTNWEDSLSVIIGNGNFDTSGTYTIYVKLEDRTTSVIQTINLAPSKKLRSLYHGSDGEGITLGRKASGPGFNDYLGANFLNGLLKNDDDVVAITDSDLTASNGYIKYDNGFMLQWKTKEITTSVTSWGSLYYYDTSMGDWTIPFVTFFGASGGCSNAQFWCGISANKTSAGTMRVVRPNNSNYTINVYVLAYGLWK